jgi:hypothetical protein
MRFSDPMLGMAATLAALALVAGCVAQPPPAVTPPIAYPASARDRLVRIALAEWEDWGRPFIDHTGPAAAAPLADRQEHDPEAFPAVLAYWSAVPGREETIAANLARFQAAEPVWTEVPWSAAFVSFVVRAAGYDRTDIPSADAHWRIVDSLMAREAGLRSACTAPSIAPPFRAICSAPRAARRADATPGRRTAPWKRANPCRCIATW